ncbi:Golgi to ER traffic protein 4 [Neolecta irregularis DAH-3]|uniref:Golgi to ER traffic protein 4 n=1 Tax=Neolecta irregularis (strain DAH-3) TaxID=1198029 RepID=A0A1U7LWZ5_NEOID|nr:Golgi to ER traffic protein 4 [Neolecta irregularis DAH-3]|eukprot:OLL27149.1 Golgi to ER traffic protein 4 [Neolecta irregularis DAH-3]
MLYEWHKEDEAHTAPQYIGRAVLQYLRLQNIEFATKSLDIFVQLLKQNESLPNQELSSSQSEMVVFPTFPLLNFLRLLVCSAQRQSYDLYSKLKSHYQTAIDESPNWNENMTKIAEIHFGQRPARQNNMLSDLLGMLAPPISKPTSTSVKQDDLD